MTQDELTKAALQKAKSDAKKAAPTPEPTPKEEVKEAKEKKETPKNVYTLGNDKTVTIKPWTGKTKKKIKKAFAGVQRLEDLDFPTVIQTLVYDQIKEDVYLSEAEQQFIMGELKAISIDDKVETEMDCPECGDIVTIKTTIQKATNYTPSNYPTTYDNITFVDIKNKEALDNQIVEIIEDDAYDDLTTPTDIEAAMHLDIKVNNKLLSVKETIEYLDNLSIKEVDSIFEEHNKVKPNYTITAEQVCPECKEKSTFNLEVISKIFETMME